MRDPRPLTKGARVFVAGASGAIGRQLVPMLVAAGHEVIGATRHPEKRDLLRELGAQPVVVDALDRAGLIDAITSARPDVIIHQLTDLSQFDLAANARLRIEGTRNLVDGARAAGVRRMVAQSLAFVYAPGSGPAVEDDPLDLDVPPPGNRTVLGVQALERAVAELPEGVVLRYGLLYGPGTWHARGGMIAEWVARGELPATDGIDSFIHVSDAARAAVEALGWPPGIYNIVDDEPAPGTAWLPAFAAALGAPTPPVAPGAERGARGASNARARALGWEPRYRSWREGFAGDLAETGS